MISGMKPNKCHQISFNLTKPFKNKNGILQGFLFNVQELSAHDIDTFPFSHPMHDLRFFEVSGLS